MYAEVWWVIGFLILTLTIGLITGRKMKDFSDYAVGHKRFGTWILVASVIATALGGRSLSNNLDFVVARPLVLVLFSGVAYLIIGRCLAMRMGKFMRHLSMAESMGTIYGKGVRYIAAIAFVIRSGGLVVLEFCIVNKLLRLFFNIDGTLFTITIAIFVTLYATIGGARSVAFTDFMQILFFGLFMPMLFVITYQKLHPPTNIIDLLLNRIRSDWVDIVINNRPKISSMVLDIATYVIPWMVSANIQRIYMSANVWQAKAVFTRAALIFTVVKILLATVGICLLHMHPDLKPSQFLHMITNDAPAGFNILLYIALISLIMSTVDSNLHMCTVTLVHDIIEPLTGSLKHKLIWARVATICVGGVGLWIAISYPDLLYTTFYHMLTFCSSMVSIPFIIAIVGFFPRTLSVLLGMGAGILVTTIMQYYLHAKWNFIFPSMLANIVVLVISHYLLPKLPHTGGMQDQEPLLIEKQLRKRKWKAYKEAIRTFCWKEYIRNIFPKKPAHFFRVGLYSEIYLCISLCYNQKLSWVYYFSPCMILATYFICYPIWHSHQTTHHKVVMHYIWLIGIFCLLFLPGALCFSISGYAIVPTIIYLLNIAVGFYFLPMPTASFMLLAAFVMTYFAALLHDVVEDSKVPLSYIESRFGRNVAYIVNQVTHMGSTFRKKKLTKEEYENILQSCVDLRVLQVKLADRLHNIQTLSFRPLEKQISVAKHTLAFYVPLGRSVGITQLTVKIQKMCTAILDGLHHSK